MIRPGLRIVTRGRDHLQVGLRPGRSAVVAVDSAHARVLDALAYAGRPEDTPAARRALEDLRAHGVVVDAAPHPPTRHPVRVLGHLGVDPLPLLATANLDASACAHPVEPGPPVLVLHPGEPPRAWFDAMTAAGTPHLFARVVEEAGVLGPLVVPGRTACLRCLDEHRAEEDPAHHDVLGRYAEAALLPRVDGVPDPLDPMTATVVTAWAARELATYLAGQRPATWSSTITLAPGMTGVEAVSWLRHPGCVCAWAGPDAMVSGTLGV